MKDSDFNWRLWLVNGAIVACLILLALTAVAAQAVSLTFADLCDGYRISKRGDDVLVRCPGSSDPIFVFKDCRSPRVTRSAGTVKLTCA